ncbi:MAG: M48 family metallopeptidase [Dysgonamonadaceae bacterium]|jgi:predicted metal-dependent hydrolase|nr:M48 family metallopeptidase [Dysgonamonadaceae bacterium]
MNGKIMIEQVKILSDTQLGVVVFRRNKQARKYIIRLKSHTVYVTIPDKGTYREAENFFIKSRNLLLEKKAELSANTVSPVDEMNLRKQARAYLPSKLAELAKLHRFEYQSVRIRKSKTRWGSCSSKGTISLSFYLMLLPHYLIEYVLLHELCHTVRMNHSPAFWELLDSYTQGKAKLLQKELRNYKIP